MRSLVTRFVAAALLAFLWCGPVSAQTDARQVIVSLSDGLIAAMKMGKATSFAKRASFLKPVIESSYDMPMMTKQVIGPAGARLSPAELTPLVEAFTRYTVDNYAAQFNEHNGERIEVGAVQPSTGGRVVVPSKIITSSGATEIDYLMAKTDAGWRILDVLLEGSISQVALRRSEFSSTFRREGANGLAQALDKKSVALEQ